MKMLLIFKRSPATDAEVTIKPDTEAGPDEDAVIVPGNDANHFVSAYCHCSTALVRTRRGSFSHHLVLYCSI